MCCLLTIFVLLGPRGAIFLWWLVEPGRWGATFDSFLVPFLGFLFLPWTTLGYVAVAPRGVEGAGEILLLALTLVLDVLSYAGGAYGNRDRFGNVYTSRP